MRKLNQIKAGAILSYLQMGISIIIQLAYTPVMIRLLGSSEYGLYNTVSSTISMLGILGLGFNASYIRYYSKYKNTDDTLSIWKLNGIMLLIFFVIGFIGLGCGIYLSFNLNVVFDKGLTEEEYSIARILMLLLTVNLAISFPMTVFQNIISAHERFVFLKIVLMIRTICNPLITIPLLLLGFRSIALVSVTVGLSLISDIIYLYYVLIKMREKFIFSGFEHGLLRSIFAYTGFLAIYYIIEQINWSVDKILLGRFKGTMEVSLYSVGYTLFHCYWYFSTAISGVFSPRVHRIVNNSSEDHYRQRNELTELFTRVGRIQFILLGLIVSGVWFFGEYFITSYFAGEEYQNSYYVALLLIIPATIPLIQNIGIEIQRAVNKYRFTSVVYTIMAMINVILSIYLCQAYGAIGSAVGTAISLIVANGIIMNVYYHKKCNIDILYFWKNIARLMRGILAPIFLGIVLKKLGANNSLPLFLLEILVYTTIYGLSMWFWGMNNYERNLIASPVRKIIKRR